MNQQRLISIKNFRAEFFYPGSEPSQSSVRTWIKNGSIKGRIIPGEERDTFYVDADAWKMNTGDSAVDDFLSTMSEVG